MPASIKIVEGSVWRYYNCPDPHWEKKCSACRQKLSTERAVCAECVNCWKVEIWKHGKAFGNVDFDGLMERVHLAADFPVVAKASRAPIQVVRTGVPGTGYPDPAMDDLLVLYARSIAEREDLRRLVQASLGLSCEAAGLIPVRRGCWRFDEVLGPWQSWYPVDSDWPEEFEPPAGTGGSNRAVITG
jgi:hypothetical protein